MSYPVLREAFRTGPYEKLVGWAHAIPANAREEIRALLIERDDAIRKTLKAADILLNGEPYDMRVYALGGLFHVEIDGDLGFADPLPYIGTTTGSRYSEKELRGEFKVRLRKPGADEFEHVVHRPRTREEVDEAAYWAGPGCEEDDRG